MADRPKRLHRRAGAAVVGCALHSGREQATTPSRRCGRHGQRVGRHGAGAAGTTAGGVPRRPGCPADRQPAGAAAPAPPPRTPLPGLSPTAPLPPKPPGPPGPSAPTTPPRPLSASRPDRAVTLDQRVHQHQDTPRRDVRPAAARAASRAASSSRAAGAAPPARPDAPRPPGPPVRHSCWVSTSVPPRAPDPSAPPADPADPCPPGPPGPPRAELKDNVEETSVTEPRPGRRAPPRAGWPELAAAPRAPERSTTPVDPLLPPAAAFEDPQRPLSPSEPTGPGDTLSASAPKVPDDPAAPVTEPCASVRCTSGSRRSHRPSCRARQGWPARPSSKPCSPS